MSRLNVEPLSREFLLQQKRCCKNSCVFCPYKNKNMENKYYVPSREDFREGFEYEKLHCTYSTSDFTLISSQWIKHVFDDFTSSENYLLDEEFQNNSIRVPFLTKEQIEEEGWKFNYLGKNDWFKGNIPILPYNEVDYPFELWFKLDKYWLGFYKSIHKIVILEKSEEYPEGESILFKGTIPSINEFRYISKLLGI